MNGLDMDKIKSNAIAYWRQSPGNRPVKLTSFARPPMMWTEGYVTSHKFIMGRTLQQAERMLGLMPGELRSGAYLYEFSRLPTASEFETRGHTQTPAGQNWSAGSAYPVGAGAPQWEIKRNSYIPTRLLAAIDPGGTIP